MPPTGCCLVLLLMAQKSQTTTQHVWNPVNNGKFSILSTGAGFLNHQAVVHVSSPKSKIWNPKSYEPLVGRCLFLISFLSGWIFRCKHPSKFPGNPMGGRIPYWKLGQGPELGIVFDMLRFATVWWLEKSDSHIYFPKWWVLNGDESHGRIWKKYHQLNKHNYGQRFPSLGVTKLVFFFLGGGCKSLPQERLSQKKTLGTCLEDVSSSVLESQCPG